MRECITQMTDVPMYNIRALEAIFKSLKATNSIIFRVYVEICCEFRFLQVIFHFHVGCWCRRTLCFVAIRKLIRIIIVNRR